MARTDSLTNYLTDLGAALREKTGTSDLIPANTFDTVITNIQTKEDLTTELTTQTNLLTTQDETIDDIKIALQGKTAGGGEEIVLQEKTIIPSTSQQNITADTGYNGLSKVVVNPVTSAIDSDIKASNIKKGVNILGVTGTVEEGITPSGTIDITENGTYDVTDYASAEVNVPSVQDTTIEDAMVMRTLSGDYVNNRITTIGTEALRATQITGLHCENVTSVGGEAVRQCNYLTNVYLPKCTNLSGYSFGLCPLLERVELGAMTNIRAYDFYSCSKLTTLIINNTTSVCSLANVSAFTGTPIASGTGYIFVPDELLSDYRSATNWSSYAEQIVPLSAYSDDEIEK